MTDDSKCCAKPYKAKTCGLTCGKCKAKVCLNCYQKARNGHVRCTPCQVAAGRWATGPGFLSDVGDNPKNGV